MKKALIIATFALAVAAGEANARQRYARFGPPPPVREYVVVRPSHRHVWVPGYYRWAGNRYNWNNGYWTVPPRPRAVWVPGFWERRPYGGGHFWISGYWR